MKNILIIVISLIIISFIGLYIVEKTSVPTSPNQVATTTPEDIPVPSKLSITQININTITLSNGKIISIDQFADEVQVSSEASFGSSDEIKDAKMSPDQKYISIAVRGAAHDFGWIYTVSDEQLMPVVFSYGGGVELGDWKSQTKVEFVVTTPQPKTNIQIIDLENLAEYPSL